MSLEELKGKKIDEITWNKEDGLICFKSNDSKEQFVFVAEGRCCSNTWIEEIALSSDFLPAIVSEVKEEESESISHPIHDCLQTYRIRLTKKSEYAYHTDDLLITFKNSSNGYYGGSLEKYEKEFDESKMVKVEADK